MSQSYRRPRTLEEVVAAFDQVEQATASLISNVSDLAFNWQPIQGKSWSLGEVLEHRIKVFTLYNERMREALEAAQRTGRAKKGSGSLTPGGFSRWFLGLIEPPARRRVPAPPASRPTTPLVDLKDPQDLAADLRTEYERLRTLIADGNGLDWNAIRFRNPFSPLIRFTLATGLLALAAHEHRHHGQMERVLQAPGYPG